MLPAALPADENERLAALRALALLDTPPEARFDRITRLACRLFRVPIALVSLVDRERQWFKSKQGLDASETARDISFCGHAIHAADLYQIEDARADARFCDNPLVSGAPGIRFYAGAPLATAGGYRIGTLCLIDHRPRHLSPDEQATLRDLADWAQEECWRGDIAQTLRLAHEQEAFLRAILNTVVDGIITIDPQGRVESFNQAATRLFGYLPEEIIGHNVNTLMPEPYRSAHDGYLARFLATRTPHVIGIGREVSGCRKDGSVFPMELAVNETVVDGRRFFTGIVRDISRRKAAEQQLQATLTLQRAILDGTTYSIISTDATGVIQTFNRAAEAMLGYRAEELVGRQTPALLHDPAEVELRAASLSVELGETTPPGFEVFVAKARRNQAEERPWTYLRKDGSRLPVLLSVTALRDASQEITGFLGIAYDISERQKIDRLKNEFVSTVSHELRTPLTSIRGALGLVAGGVAGALPAQAKQLIDIAHGNSERLVRLINDILDIEKIESGKIQFNFSVQALRPLLEQAIEANRAYAEQLQVGIVLSENSADGRVRIDVDRMMQVIANLLSNAAKYSPAQASVEVSVERRAHCLRLTVRDRGQGIPPAFQARIFQKFSQADGSDTRRQAGTGLGLAISRSLVESMGGQIGFDTSPAGSSFWIDLPEIVPMALPPAEPGGTLPPCVLVCEDNPDIAHLLGMILETGGYRSEIAHSVAQAKSLLNSRTYVAMTLDITLPGEDGIALIADLHSLPPAQQVPIIVVSACSRSEKAWQLGSIPVADWLEKPIDPQRLLAAVRQGLRHGAQRPRILHVDDDLDLLQVVTAMAGDLADFDHAPDLHTATQLLARQAYDLVILDLALPDGSGSELLPLISALRPEPRVLVFSASDVPRETAAQFAACLVKTVTSNDDLLQTIAAQIRR